MGASLIQILVLAGIALYLIFRLRDVLGTRDGFEPDRKAENQKGETVDATPSPELVDEEIADYVDPESVQAEALLAMKEAESGFEVKAFLEGSKAAYEMILMDFEAGNLGNLDGLVDDEIMESFAEAVASREDQGLRVEAKFVGFRSIDIVAAEFDEEARRAEISVCFKVELISVVRDAADKIVEGDAKTPKTQTDIWTFARDMGSEDVNWVLVATGLDEAA